MKEFFILEGAYIVIAMFVLAITAYVTTRSFMSKSAFKKGMISVFSLCLGLILLHFYVTKNRIEDIKKAFSEGKPILCENRIYTKAAQFITVLPGNEWEIKDNTFISPNYTRSFHLARCIRK